MYAEIFCLDWPFGSLRGCFFNAKNTGSEVEKINSSTTDKDVISEFMTMALSDVMFSFKEVIGFRAIVKDAALLVIEVETASSMDFTLIHCNMAHRIWRNLNSQKHEFKLLQIVGKQGEVIEGEEKTV